MSLFKKGAFFLMMPYKHKVIEAVENYFNSTGSIDQDIITKTEVIFLDDGELYQENNFSPFSLWGKINNLDSRIESIIFVYIDNFDELHSYRCSYFMRKFFENSTYAVTTALDINSFLNSFQKLNLYKKKDTKNRIPLEEAKNNFNTYIEKLNELFRENKENIINNLSEWFRSYSYHAELAHKLGGEADKEILDYFLCPQKKNQ